MRTGVPWIKGPQLNLYIDPVNGLIVAVGCLVGYLVYRRPIAGTGVQTPQQTHGDLAGGVAAAAAAILILAFLFGRGDGREAQVEEGSPGPVPTIYETPAGGAQPSTSTSHLRLDNLQATEGPAGGTVQPGP